jgi:hypothetical protein
MALQFENQVTSVELPTPIITGLDFNNDGSLLAVAFHPQNEQGEVYEGVCVHVYRTADASLVAEHGLGFGRGVLLSGDGTQLYFALQNTAGNVELRTARLDSGEPEQLAIYSGEMIHALRRDESGRTFAVIGNAAEVWDGARREVIRFKESNASHKLLQAWLNRSGSHLYLYGLRESEITRLNILSDQFTGQWDAPQPAGQQVIVAPSEQFLVAVGASEGVFVYNLEDDSRYDSAMYDERAFAQPFLFSHDSSLLITLEVNLYGQPLPAGPPVIGPELSTGSPTAVASAWNVPVIAYAIKNRVFWVRLRDAELA